MYINRIGIGLRLTIAFLILIALMVLSSSMGLRQVSLIQNQAQRMELVDLQANAILRIYNGTLNLTNELEDPVANRNLVEMKQVALDSQAALQRDIENALELIRNPNNPIGNKEFFLSELQTVSNTLPPQIDQLVNLAEEEDWRSVDTRLNGQMESLSSIAELLVLRMNDEVNTARQETQVQRTIAEQRVRVIIIGTALATTIVAGILAYMVTRSIIRPLRQLDKGAQAWARGDLSYRAEVEGVDELARFGDVLNDSAARLEELYGNLGRLVDERTQELQHRAMQLETSMDVAQRINSILDLNSLLRQVAELIKDRYQYDYVGIFLLSDDGREIALRTGTSHQGSGLVLPLEENSIVTWAARHKRVHLAEDVTQDERFHEWVGMPETQSELAIPLRMGRRLLGVLDIQSSQVKGISPDDVPLLHSIADQVAIAINNAYIYENEQTQRRLAETLHQVGRALTSTLDMNEVLDLILKRLKPLIPYDRGSLLLADDNKLQIKAARGFPPNVNPINTHVTIHGENENDVFLKIYSSKKPLIIENVNNYPSWKRVENIPTPGSWMGVPLIRENAVVGMLSLARDDVEAYSQADAETAEAVASQAAIALENAQLYERVKRFSAQLEYEVRNRTEALQTAYTQLERLDRTKSNFISIASHELRTPITVLKGYAQILLKEPQLQENENYVNMLDGILKGAVRLHEIVNSMLDIAKIDARTLQLYHEEMAISSTIYDVIGNLENALENRKITAVVTPGIDDLPIIEADQEGIHKVLYHLIVNAIKYTPDEGNVIIRGRSWEGEPPEQGWPTSGVEVIVEDEGIGINPDDLDVIFDKFYQTGEVALHSSGKTKFKGGGSGLGLAIVKGIVIAHSGLVWAESEGNNEEEMPGSRFHVVLPLHQGPPEEHNQNGA